MTTIPKVIADELAALEAQVKRIHERIAIYRFVIQAYEDEDAGELDSRKAAAELMLEPSHRRKPVEATRVPIAKNKHGVIAAYPRQEYDYQPLLDAIRAGGDEGVPALKLPYDHHSRLTVLLRRHLAHKLENGNWVLT